MMLECKTRESYSTRTSVLAVVINAGGLQAFYSVVTALWNQWINFQKKQAGDPRKRVQINPSSLERQHQLSSWRIYKAVVCNFVCDYCNLHSTHNTHQNTSQLCFLPFLSLNGYLTRSTSQERREKAPYIKNYSTLKFRGVLSGGP